MVDRTTAGALIPKPVAETIIQSISDPQLTRGSAVLKLARNFGPMTSGTLDVPVLSLLPSAAFLNATTPTLMDTAIKPLTELAWSNVTLRAYEVAVILALPENVEQDASVDVWASSIEKITEAFGAAIDKAIILGQGAPTGAPQGIIPAAIAAGKNVTAANITWDNVLGQTGILSMIELSGYNPTAYVGSLSAKGLLRNVRTTSGFPLFNQLPGVPGRPIFEIQGVPVIFPLNGLFNGTQNALLAGDWQQLIYSIRTDIRFSKTDSATLVDATGNVLYSLFQQDMVAYRMVMRIAWAVPNPVNLTDTSATRYPFAVLQSPTP